jgi:Fe-S cluster biogenesis protein NfuA
LGGGATTFYRGFGPNNDGGFGEAEDWKWWEREEVKRMRENVEKALEKIRPALQADGGNVELIDVVDGVVKVRLTGACGGCPMSQMTLKMGVEKVIKQYVPEVKSVETA